MQQARDTGVFLDSLLVSEGITADNITWMSSPFLRCVQTSHIALDAFQNVKGSVANIKILPEYSVFEWDGHNGKLHESLPALEERQHYFPRLDATYESLFVPPLPEPRSAFHGRCQRAVNAISNSRHGRFRPGTALIVVSHAAGCIGMAAAATNRTLADITPAAPCSIYRLTRTSSDDTNETTDGFGGGWTMDAHDAVHSMNGHTAHVRELGTNTVPWNNFGDKKVFRGYTGPPTSRFAPAGYSAATATAAREEL